MARPYKEPHPLGPGRALTLPCGWNNAGLYIPMLSDRILNHTVEAKAHGVNLAGFMIGNGCPGWDVTTCTPYSSRMLNTGGP